MGLGPCVVERNGSLVSKLLEFSWTLFGSRVNMGKMKCKYILYHQVGRETSNMFYFNPDDKGNDPI